MKKKLEAELISIAHRILKLKNRAELNQLQQETLKLYEKISVLKFVEDNFADVQPTIGYASAEAKLEEVYELEPEQAEAAEPENKEPKKEENVNEEPVAEVKPEEETVVAEVEENEAEQDEVEEVEEVASENEVENTEAPDEEKPEEVIAEEVKEEEAVAETEEPEHKIEIEKPEEELQAMEEGAAAVFEKEQDADDDEEEKAADAEMITIEPDENTKVEDSNLSFDFAFERKAAADEPAKKEVTFEDFHLDYKELDFVKKSDMEVQAEAQKQEDKPKEETPQPGLKPEYAIAHIEVEPEEVKAEPVQEEPKAEEQKEEVKEFFKYDAPKQDTPSTVKSINDSFGKIISLGLNDRIAFEKHLFSGSADDLNRVLSQLNTLHSFTEAKQFIEDLVKPDYNGWKDKEEYEERFMQLVEKKFE